MDYAIQPHDFTQKEVSLGRGALLGRFNEEGSKEPLPRTSSYARFHRIFLHTADTEVVALQGEIAQLLLYQEDSLYYLKDLGAGNKLSSLLNGQPFDESKLLINDRISLGKNIHFRFTGRGLVLVPTQQGGHIIAKGLRKSFTKKRQKIDVIQGINLTIHPNQFIGILGLSGCGKTTLLRLLSGSHKLDSGQITINGLNYKQHKATLRSMVGVVPQDDIVHQELSIENAVRYSARLRLPPSVPKPAIEDLVYEVISTLNLWEHRHKQISNLSGGQRKRASIATEILKHTAVLFLDEPSSGLDPATEEDLMAWLRKLANLGRTVICTTHVLERAYLFNQVCFMHKGKLIYQGKPSEARKHFDVKKLIDIYKLLEDPGAKVPQWPA